MGITKLEKHKEICKKLNDIYRRKNNDYSDSFGESYKEWGKVAAVVRIDDKMRRIKHLTKNGNNLVDESLVDSLMDLSNYAIMLLIELEEDRE